MAGQQQEEIETIRSRTIEVKLSDADVKRISEKAAAHGLTVGELIENFIGDLVCGTYSNGSDERMYAEQWFERCWFGMFPDLTFLRYLIEWGGLDEVIGAWENIKSTEENIQTSEEALASGVMKGRGGRTYTWKDLTNGKGKISSNYNADILGVGKGQGTSSSTEEKRIIKPEEFAYLKDVVCVFPNGYKRLQKANYYEDKTFTDRM